MDQCSRSMYAHVLLKRSLSLSPAARKRQIFDQCGEEGLKGHGGFSFQGDPHAMFSQFFGGQDPFTMFSGFGTGFGDGTSFGFSSTGGPGGFGFQSFGSPREGEGMDYTNSGSGAGASGFGFGTGTSGFGTGAYGFGAGPSGSKRQRGPQQDPPVEHALMLSLEELFFGCSKKMKISRQVLDHDHGTTSRQDKVVTIDVKPGWKAGTKIRFEREGDQAIGKIPADIIFVVQEKPHPLFTRDGNNLKHKVQLSLRDALLGGKVQVPTIAGKPATLQLKEVVNPHTVMTVHGEGMPLSKQPKKRGDLLVKFDIVFPKHLTRDSKELINNALPVN